RLALHYLPPERLRGARNRASKGRLPRLGRRRTLQGLLRRQPSRTQRADAADGLRWSSELHGRRPPPDEARRRELQGSIEGRQRRRGFPTRCCSLQPRGELQERVLQDGRGVSLRGR